MNVAAQAMTQRINEAFMAFVKLESDWNILSARDESERCACYDRHISELRTKMRAASDVIEGLMAERDMAPWVGA